ncbi:hypothetical protein F4803DRAFT_556017 [Xylaria telfairii]|nr:hypothetical protein F4803DRAFT_556017 [Xylaria telfairii]
MDSPCTGSPSPSSQFAQLANDLSNITIVGFGEKGFQYKSEGVWKPADAVIDNGMQQGYSVYYLNDLIGRGKLIVYDEIDKETDILDGGPLSYGWVTNFPENYIQAPDHILARYQEGKMAFRKDFTTWSFAKDENTEGSIASSFGQSVYKLAASDPLTEYGLGETKISQRTKFSIGFNGTSHRLPTITSDWNYYSALLSTEDDTRSYSCTPTEGGSDDTASDITSVTIGRGGNGGYN